MQGIPPLEFWKKNLCLTRNQFFNLTNELQRYISVYFTLNNMLRSARNQIEYSFGRLRARWANTYKENGFEIRNTTNCRLCLFYFAQLP